MNEYPNFLIVGAAKAGTSALYEYLLQHPGVFLTNPKEPHYFAFQEQQVCFRGPGDDRHINQFAVTSAEGYRELFRTVEPRHVAVGEASVSSLYVPTAVATIHRERPGARLICMLRDPVERAFSNYQYLRTKLREPLDRFVDALQAEEDRIAAGWQHIWHYQRLGFYADQVERLYQWFPPEQILVLIYDDFRKDPVQVVNRTLLFLGLEADFQPHYVPQPNRSGRPKSLIMQRILRARTPLHLLAHRWLPRRWKQRIFNANISGRREAIDPEVAARLARQYEHDVCRLSELLGRDLTGWTRRWLTGGAAVSPGDEECPQGAADAVSHPDERARA